MIFRSKRFYISFVIISILSIIFYKYHNIITGDGVGYYAYLRSLLFDHDLNFYNEFIVLNKNNGALPDVSKTLPNGLLPNPWSIGLSIIWAPFLVIVFWFGKLLNLNQTGFELPYQLATYLSGIIAAWLCIRTTQKTLDLIDIKVHNAHLWLFFLCTPLIYYGLWGAGMAHIYSAASISIILYLYLRLTQSKPQRKVLILLGLTMGLSSLIRWQNILFLIPLLGVNTKLRSKLLTISLASMVFSLQIVVWWIIYQTPFMLPQGVGFFELNTINILKVLFDTPHGLLAHPVELIGFVGYFWFSNNQRKSIFYHTLLLISVVFSLQLLTNSFLHDWFGGYSFGNRRMADFFSIYSIGFFWIIQRLNIQKYLNYILLFFTTLNFYQLKNFVGLSDKLALILSLLLSLLWFLNKFISSNSHVKLANINDMQTPSNADNT